ncbi:DUF1273 domain-containing protein [Cohnella suwonensis]|uniref:DUF1273 domain-containing protein n=1 Tax=Cohnella suwonensis TaxID=696072 RepID=A0ABW0M3E0_9BACL
MKNILVTGYRAHELGIYDQKHAGIAYIRKAIATKLVPLLEDGLEWVITPGQYGVDLWACETALELKERYPQLKVSVLTAFLNPEENWKKERQNYYRQLTQRLDFYGAVSKQPYVGPWQFTARDDLLLRKTDGIVLVYDEDAGEASPRFMKEKALRKNEKEGYGYFAISAQDIQDLATEESYGDAYFSADE